MLRVLLLILLSVPLCAQPDPPVNDDCNAAIMLTPSAGPTCDNLISVTTAGATNSLPQCGSFDVLSTDDDVWFSFTCTASRQLLYLENIVPNDGFDGSLGYEVFFNGCGAPIGLNCGTFDPGSSSTASPLSLPGLTVGNSYLLRIYTDGVANTAAFDICLATPAPNDRCDGALALPVNEDDVCTSVLAQTTQGATRSGAGRGDCSNIRVEDDLWYTFTATNTSHFLQALNVDNPNNDFFPHLYYDLREGTQCGPRDVIICERLTDEPQKELTGLTIGTTYLLRIFTRFASEIAEFDLCLTADPASLPVSLMSFTGQTMDKYNQLNWRTATEKNTEWHILQRSTDGISDWTEVARTQGAGWSNEEQAYSLNDESPTPISFYRLLNRDFDDAEQLSGIIRLERDAITADVLSAFPNPVGDALNLALTSTLVGDLRVDLTDITGREVLRTEQQVGEGAVSISLDLSGVSRGTYLVRSVDAGGKVLVARVVRR